MISRLRAEEYWSLLRSSIAILRRVRDLAHTTIQVFVNTWIWSQQVRTYKVV